MSHEIVILAAGKGSRMLSRTPKVLHMLCGQSLLSHQLNTLAQVSPHAIHVVVAKEHALIKREISPFDNIHLVCQHQPQGTGHAALQGLSNCHKDSIALVLAGDIPLIRAQTIQNMLAAADASLVLLQTTMTNPYGYGRILRNRRNVIQAIVEQQDATVEQQAIKQVYCGVLAGKVSVLTDLLAKVDNRNKQNEYYLTDIVHIARTEGHHVAAVDALDIFDYCGINSQSQLVQLECRWQRHLADTFMEQGLRLYDPAQLYLRGNLSFGTDVQIDINAIISGNVTLANNVTVNAHCVLDNCTIGSDTVINPFCHISQATIGKRCVIGPYARIRPGCILDDAVKIGNFVETKNALLATGSKANHLSYIGDATVGANSNIGAGSITCNYDGRNKHQTTIGNNVFVGSNTSLVAPVNIGNNATIAAGSVITDDVGKDALAIARSRQTVRDNWKKNE